MSEGGVLKRKVVAGRARSSTVVPPGAVKALGLALGRAGQHVQGLGLAVESVRMQQMSLTELLELPQDLALLAVIEGPGDGLGLMALTPPVLTSFIEVLTTGRLSRATPQPRKPTRTDAAMAAGLIDSILAELEAALSGSPDLAWAGEFRYASFLPDARPLGLILDDQAYRVLTADLKLGGGSRHGEVLLALPARGRAKVASEATDAGLGGQGVQTGGHRSEALEWDDAMERSILSVESDLTAVLHRMTLPLSAMLAFEPGLLVPLPMAALDQVAIEGPGGRRLAEGRLGQNRGHRALRLTLSDVGAPEVDAPVAMRALPPASAPPEPQRQVAMAPSERKTA
jgi:flagellar motor switch protein FliM